MLSDGPHTQKPRRRLTERANEQRQGSSLSRSGSIIHTDTSRKTLERFQHDSKCNQCLLVSTSYFYSYLPAGSEHVVFHSVSGGNGGEGRLSGVRLHRKVRLILILLLLLLLQALQYVAVDR